MLTLRHTTVRISPAWVLMDQASILKGRQNLQNSVLPAKRERVTVQFKKKKNTHTQDFFVPIRCYAFNLPSQAGKILSVMQKANFKDRWLNHRTSPESLEK